IPYTQVEEFVETYQDDMIQFISAEERHLVRGETMSQVTDFFIRAKKSL
nr:esterase [Enterococcus sp.]